MCMLQNLRIPPQAYFKRLYQLNDLIKQCKLSQNVIALERNKDVACSATKLYRQKRTSKPVFDYSEIQKLQNTQQAILRGTILLQHIAHDEQQTLARLKQTALSSSL